MLGNGDEYSANHPKLKISTVALKSFKKWALKYSIEITALLDFVYLFTTFFSKLYAHKLSQACEDNPCNLLSKLLNFL